jgi:hypothetical protein
MTIPNAADERRALLILAESMSDPYGAAGMSPPVVANFARRVAALLAPNEDEASAKTPRTGEPKRIQLSRRKGWRRPQGAVNVSRPTQWGNPWRIGSTDWTVLPGGKIDKTPHPPLTAEQAVASFRNSIEADPDRQAIIRRELGGKDLACWCPLDQPCHADVLLQIANVTTPA